MSQLQYQPSDPQEQAYFEHLFQRADLHRQGSLSGQDAVAFFSTSKLPVDQLKTIWQVADQPPTNTLDRAKFAVAVRLIQLSQNQVKGQGPNLQPPAGVALRPVYFEGVPQPQQQQPPQQQQQQQQLPPQPVSPGGPPRAPGGAQPPPQPPYASSTSSQALTTQDPYTLSPAEQSRYETLFPDYVQQDGFVHGQQAVELFSKSGLTSTQLAQIWNLADSPVDNKLSKMEFVTAMHLIVCLSKKGLPLPPSLPQSLQQFKSQQQALAGGGAGGMQQQQQPPITQIERTPSRMDASVASSIGQASVTGLGGSHNLGQQPPAPQMQQQSMMQPPQQQQQQQIASPPLSPTRAPAPVQMQQQQTGGPPPLTQPGGGAASISDAFEGLSTTSGAGGMSGGMGMGMGAAAAAGADPAQAYLATAPPVMTNASFDGNSGGGGSAREGDNGGATNMTAASGYGGETNGSNGMNAMNQQQHAAHTASSASAASGDQSEELQNVKAILQKLQAENISLRAQLGTMTDDEKSVQHELHNTVQEIGTLSNSLTTLRAQVLSSKAKLVEATAELKAAQEKKGVMTDLISEATATKAAIEDAYSGIEKATATASASSEVPPIQHSDAFSSGDLFGFDSSTTPVPSATTSDLQQPQNSIPEAPAPGPEPVGLVQSVSTASSSAAGGGAVDYGASTQPPAAEDGGGGLFGTPLGGTGASTLPGMGGPAAGHPNDAFGMMGNSHQKSKSNSSDDFGPLGDAPMGGVSAPLPTVMDTTTAAAAAAPASGALPSLTEVEEMKSKAREADQIATEAEDSRKQISAQAAELRRVADQAEAALRKVDEANAKKDGKKKGMFGGGRGHKKAVKEREGLAKDAAAKKQQYLQVESQLNDAAALAVETKREAEQLRKDAEDAEMAAVSAASMQQSQPTPAAPPQQEPVNGHGAYGMPAPAAMDKGDNGEAIMGGGALPTMGAGTYDLSNSGVSSLGNLSASAADGAGAAPAMSFNPSVMGTGAGVDIPIPDPVPAGDADPYSNPFG